MHLFLTSVLPFLAHNHPSAAAFLTCRHHNFHASIIPEFLSDEQRVESFCGARQQNELYVSRDSAYKELYNLFIQTPLMQFSPSLIVSHKDCGESILKPLLQTEYFTRTLQRCSVQCDLSNDLLQGLSKVQTLTKLDLFWIEVYNEHLEIIVNTFASLEALIIRNAEHLKIDDPITAIRMNSPPPPATKTLRSLKMNDVDAVFVTQFVSHFTNLRKLELSPPSSNQVLNLLSLSSSLPLLENLSLFHFTLENTESLKSLVNLSRLQCTCCRVADLSFLTPNNTTLSTLRICTCDGLLTSSSFTSLANASNLHELQIVSDKFDNDCLQYLQKLTRLRKLDLSSSNINGDEGLFKVVMQNLFELEELSLWSCLRVGDQGAIAGALYSSHSRLRVLNLSRCSLVDDDLNGIGVLKNTLEVLDLSENINLTNTALEHCKDLVKLKNLNLTFTGGITGAITDLSRLKNCVNLEELNVSRCYLTDDSFNIFSGDPNSFPRLRVLDLSYCQKLTEKVFEHLSKNNHLVYQLRELNVMGKAEIVELRTAQDHIYQLKGLQRFFGIPVDLSKTELLRSLPNLDEIV